MYVAVAGVHVLVVRTPPLSRTSRAGGDHPARILAITGADAALPAYASLAVALNVAGDRFAPP
jgi:hypothetical protein